MTVELPQLPGDWSVESKTHTNDMRIGPETYLIATRVDNERKPVRVKVELGSVYQEDNPDVERAFEKAWLELYEQVMATEGTITKARRIADFVNKINKGLWPRKS